MKVMMAINVQLHEKRADERCAPGSTVLAFTLILVHELDETRYRFALGDQGIFDAIGIGVAE